MKKDNLILVCIRLPININNKFKKLDSVINYIKLNNKVFLTVGTLKYF